MTTTSFQTAPVPPAATAGAEPMLVRRHGGLLAFAIPALAAIEIGTGLGFLYAGEILALALLPVAYRGRRLIAASPAVRWLVIGGALWVLSLVLTDVWHGTALDIALRGWAEVLVPTLTIGVLWVLIADYPRRIIPALLGVAAALALNLTLLADAAEARAAWQLGGVTALAIATMIALTRTQRGGRVLAATVALVLGGFGFLVEARGAGGVLVAAAAYVAWTGLLEVRARRKISARQLAGGVLTALVLGAAMLGAYGVAASSGVLGNRQATQFQHQSAGRLGVLAGGRTSIVASLIAIGDSPIIGIGSEAGRVDFDDYAERTAEFFAQQGYDPRVLFIKSDGIFDHSFVLGAWVSAGILSLVFWAVVAVLIVRALRRAPQAHPHLQLLIAWVAAFVAWGMIATPFGGRGRVFVPVLLLALVTLPRLAAIGWPRRLPSRAPMSQPMAPH